MNKNIIVIPTYNEKENIEKLIKEILFCCKDSDVLIVDDNSPDGTGVAADNLSRINSEVKVLHRETKLGLGKAYIEGFKWALERGYDTVCQMDADFSHNPQDIPRLMEAVKYCDVCIGSRYIKGGCFVHWPFWRKMLSGSANLYIQLITGLPVKDGTSGFKCFKRKVLDAITVEKIDSEGFSFQFEMNHRAWKRKFLIHEIPVTFIDRQEGSSKMSQKEIAESLSIVFKLIRAKD